MKKYLLLLFLFMPSLSFAFDDECIATLRQSDADGQLDRIISNDRSGDWVYFHDDKKWRPKSPVNCKSQQGDYERVVCADPSLKKLDLIAYTSALQNIINASGELLSKNKVLGSGFNQKWVGRPVADGESACLKLASTDQVKLKLNY